MELCCQEDNRRDAVRSKSGWNGLDYLEVVLDQSAATGPILSVYFLGKLPPEFKAESQDLTKYLQLQGGRLIQDIRILNVEPVIYPDDSEQDDILQVRLDQSGDFSIYTLRLVGVENIDRRYDHLDFSFKIDCPSDLDCVPGCACEPPALVEPDINYLAKDYASFRQLILDRLAVVMPDWPERHVPDMGIALVELLAYAGDYLSYFQDAVATEAYLETARQRVSIRRHVRLVDYTLHEGCNSRAWVSVEIVPQSPPVSLLSTDIGFLTGLNDTLSASSSILSKDDLSPLPALSYEIFEPMPFLPARNLVFYGELNEIAFYTWGDRECCLAKGSVSAVLLDTWTDYEKKLRALDSLAVGDKLIFEEVIGPKTGLAEDADPLRSHVVRITGIARGVDSVVLTATGQPTPYVEIQWSQDDALPFTFCISTLGPPPECRYINNISVARGNVFLVDLGQTLDVECLGKVQALSSQAVCECDGHPGEIQITAALFRPRLSKSPLTFSAPLPADTPTLASAQALLAQDVRTALPDLRVYSLSPELSGLFGQIDPCSLPYSLVPDATGNWLKFPIDRLPKVLVDRYKDGMLPLSDWQIRYDLIESGPDDRHFVVEIDNDGIVQLRFGDGDLGYRPEAGMTFFARYRVDNGVAGNVGAESINRLVLKNTQLSGVSIKVRNPLPAVGGTDPELIAEAKLFAPHDFRKRLERAITASDYSAIVERNVQLQRASAALVWTGSWYEADVAVDPLGTETPGSSLIDNLEDYLYRYRRMGHDLRVLAAQYVPIDLKLEICVLPHYQRAHVQKAILDAFSNRRLPGGKLGFFHPDNLSFGVNIEISKIIARGMTIAGVECLRVTRLKRQFEAANGELENGLLILNSHEIAQLDNNPVYPEHGKLELSLSGGR